MERRLCDRCGQRPVQHVLELDGRRHAASCSQCWFLVCEEWATGELVRVGSARPQYVERFKRQRRL